MLKTPDPGLILTLYVDESALFGVDGTTGHKKILP
jgi:hypothetical protein